MRDCSLWFAAGILVGSIATRLTQGIIRRVFFAPSPEARRRR